MISKQYPRRVFLKHYFKPYDANFVSFEIDKMRV